MLRRENLPAPAHMETVIVGPDRTTFADYVPRQNFLILDDGTVIDQLHRPNARHLDLEHDTLNPLKRRTYLSDREFRDIIDAIARGGDSTLTRSTGLAYLFRQLRCTNPRTIAEIVPEPDKKSSPAQLWAYDALDELMLSPVLKRVLASDRSMSLKGTLIARLDPKQLGEWDCRAIGAFLASKYGGTVVIPNLALYYAKGLHERLIHEKRLVAGVDFLDQIPDLRNELLLMRKKVPARPIADDAETLAVYAGHQRGTEAFSTFVYFAMHPA